MQRYIVVANLYRLQHYSYSPCFQGNILEMQKSSKNLFSKFLARFLIRIEATDIKSSSRHFPGMHLYLLYHVMSEITRGILATTILNGMSYLIQVLLQVDIEWWHSPMALWLLRLLFHIQYHKYHFLDWTMFDPIF